MKKIIAVCLVLALVVSLVGCYGYSNDDLPSKEQLAQMDEAELNSLIPGYSIEQVKDVWNVPDQTSDNKAIWKLNDTVCLVASYNNHGKIVVVALEDVADIDGSFKLQATVIEISDNRFIVQPLEGSSGFKSTEQILVPMENMAASPEPQIGDILEIVYSGDILPTQPAELTEIQSIRVIEQAVAETPNALVPSIMYNGEIYGTTGKQIPAEVDESAYAGKITSTVPLSEWPSEEGQANFGEVGTPYAVTSEGFVVLMNNEWTVFEVME